MLKEVHVILWDQITAQIFPVHRVLFVSMAAPPMNLNAKIKTSLKRKDEKKTRRRHFFKEPRMSHFLCNLGYNGFHIESYGPYFKKVIP